MALAYRIFTSILVFNNYMQFTIGRYTMTSKLSMIENFESGKTSFYKSIINGKIFKREKNSYSNKNTEPCYLYFANDLDISVSFAYFYNSFPLDVAPQNIFFWPEHGKNNFTVELESEYELDYSNVSVYCGDMTDILGENAVEYERAESIKLGSFPKDPTLLNHFGYFNLVTPVLENCKVELHFPEGKFPSKFEFADRILNKKIKTEIKNNKRTLSFSGFDKLDKNVDNVFTKSSNVIFNLQYSDVDSIAYSYNIISDVVCEKDGFEVDQSMIMHESNKKSHIWSDLLNSKQNVKRS